MRQLSVCDLAVERGGRPILADLSFTLRSRELLLVTGRNGAGKSTLLRAIAGLLPHVAGTISIDPADGPVGEHAHYFGHLDGLKSSLTVADNLALWTRIAGAPGVDIIAALEEVGLDHLDDLPAAYLSAGQRRRVGLARLLLVRRPLWLLDEPTSALDAEAEATFGDLLAAHLARGGLAIAATHRPMPVPATATLALEAR
ncbi:heme ABC exporter ATP-binding protein CcmA [Kaistia dalseonensis]|uniref:Heme exporter protein A n=1 Tax=Kaistia dalseonensis TaxID=410840 RepID=A0ABU0H706_9HYPH|nr:heme ABC exporter ATP-binding protein CcmA [Kaistia dalseonensis]MCX5494665.1 heme ABC exporter ATP-binding protein CcmA [Kaistia dalseonensis]MDQ0437246.1 heme exporter protein A [Kaistia dalseonensis]